MTILRLQGQTEQFRARRDFQPLLPPAAAAESGWCFMMAVVFTVYQEAVYILPGISFLPQFPNNVDDKDNITL